MFRPNKVSAALKKTMPHVWWIDLSGNRYLNCVCGAAVTDIVVLSPPLGWLIDMIVYCVRLENRKPQHVAALTRGIAGHASAHVCDIIQNLFVYSLLLSRAWCSSSCYADNGASDIIFHRFRLLEFLTLSSRFVLDFCIRVKEPFSFSFFFFYIY